MSLPAKSIGPPPHAAPKIAQHPIAMGRRGARALDLLLTLRSDAGAAIEQIITDKPYHIVAHCLRMALIVRDDNRAQQVALAASIAAIEAAGAAAGDAARRHAAAAGAWLAQDSLLARQRYGAIVADEPRDALALAVAHALDFRLGDRLMLRDRVATAITAWNCAMPGYAAVLAMHAFGLEESRAYREAETLARQALALRPGLPAAIHVIAHVMEMEGRAAEGLAFLDKNEAAWREGNGYSLHLAWHRALFHLRLGDTAAALALYDERIAPAPTPSLSALADASALLWRLGLRHAEPGARWSVLADRWESAALADARAFYIVHAMMALAGAGRVAAAKRLLSAQPHLDISDTVPILPDQALVLPVSEALLAFAARDYATCIARIERVQPIAHRCGGSLAQCDLLPLTLAEATARAREARMAA